MKSLLILLVIIIVVVVGYFLLKNNQGEIPVQTIIGSPSFTPTPVPFTPGPSTIQEPPIAREITIAGNEFKFDPSSITVRPGERIKIVFNNIGALRHNLVLGALGVSTNTIDPGETTTVEFTAPLSGTYTFVCTVPGHKDAGMVGELKVQ